MEVEFELTNNRSTAETKFKLNNLLETLQKFKFCTVSMKQVIPELCIMLSLLQQITKFLLFLSCYA